MRGWRWGAEQRSPRAGGKAGLTPDDRGNQRQKKELPVSLCEVTGGTTCHSTVSCCYFQPLSSLARARVPLLRPNRDPSTQELPSQLQWLAPQTPPQTGHLRKTRSHSQHLSCAPEQHKVCQAGRNPVLNRVGT